METIAHLIPQTITKTKLKTQQEHHTAKQNYRNCLNCQGPDKCPFSGWKSSDTGYYRCSLYEAWLIQQRINKKLKTNLPQKFRHYTFSNFIERSEDSKKALELTKQYLDKAAWESGINLILLGKYGTGKTHLAAAVTQAVIMELKTAIFMTTSRLNEGGFTKIEERFNQLAEADFIVLDDVIDFDNKLISNGLFKLINSRYEEEKGMMITSNLSLNKLPEALGERVFDRLVEGAIIVEIKDIGSYRPTKRAENMKRMVEKRWESHTTK